ncbi:MAG: glutamate racemase [Candidatus Marinimicrobia bacterium]|nr:glutamate racemase [Candidatus Neomarinimicrobiota bacterium]MBT3617726.1 glutamate racemase [Candidatus Neomarinimicrobiota bacterium]MBT3828399.1 glutamate racemase [Candidatus Neomarinimicrobiota bacterium]MBT3997547.1 glutamate racemase [Candidatus Neomarinimicrobiota bacterium]MBT4280708.1 glutamate racemase [Candidatus Neomarinimicrobiota bacterium]
MRVADNRPIGVFDSGLGGLTVVKALQKLLPSESILYFGDTARVPYGNKSKNLIELYSTQISSFLYEKKCKAFVVACNTASAQALEVLQKTFPIPVIGVIEPGVNMAISTSKNGHIGVIGTVATIKSDAYEIALKNKNENVIVLNQPCPLFVPLVEEGWITGDVPKMVAKTYLKGMNADQVDTIILGCTHYPLLKEIIQSSANGDTILIDSAEAVATEVKQVLQKNDLITEISAQGKLESFVTDVPLRFEMLAHQFLGSPIAHVSTVTLH